MPLTEKFDPFDDRRARLVRNNLSAAFTEGLGGRDFSFVADHAAQLKKQYPGKVYAAYLENRLRRYRVVFDAIARQPALKEDIFRLTVLLWEQSLFFEVHELLEKEWGREEGPYRKALQGLIQAAGYYLLLEAGNLTGAGKLADKAAVNLAANRPELPDYLRIDGLIEKLRWKDRTPPPLG